MYTGLLSRCVSFFNTVLFSLSYLFFLLYSDFSYLPPGVACNYCWSRVLNADLILPGDGQHNFICIVQDFWLCGSLLMNWQASASSNIFCLSQVLLLHSEKSRDFMKLWFSTAGERRPSSWSTKNSQAVYGGKWAGVFSLTSWLVSFTCLHYMIKAPLTPTLTTPAWELEIKTSVLTESGTLAEELVLNIQFQSMEDGMKMASCWR